MDNTPWDGVPLSPLVECEGGDEKIKAPSCSQSIEGLHLRIIATQRPTVPIGLYLEQKNYY